MFQVGVVVKALNTFLRVFGFGQTVMDNCFQVHLQYIN